MAGFVHFSYFLIPSEKYYNSQSFWITLYLFARLSHFTNSNYNMVFRFQQELSVSDCLMIFNDYKKISNHIKFY